MQIGQEVISMFDELFPGTIDQLNKLTVVRYDHIKDTNAPSDERSRHITLVELTSGNYEVRS